MVLLHPRRAFRAIPILLLVVVGLSGCLSADSANDPATDDTAASETNAAREAGDPPGPYIEFIPGAEHLEGEFLQGGGTLGIVWDVADGDPVEGARIIAHCMFLEYPFPVDSLTGTSDELGRFEIHATLFFAGCDIVVYDVSAPGYALAEPVETGPLGPDAQYFVKLGLRAV